MHRLFIAFITIFTLITPAAQAVELIITDRPLEQTVSTTGFMQFGVRTQAQFSHQLREHDLETNEYAGVLYSGVIGQVGPEISLGMSNNTFTLNGFVSILMGTDPRTSTTNTALQFGVRSSGHVSGPLHLGGYFYVMGTPGDMELPSGVQYRQFSGQLGLDLSLVSDIRGSGRLEVNHRIGCGPMSHTINSNSDFWVDQMVTMACSTSLSVQLGGTN